MAIEILKMEAQTLATDIVRKLNQEGYTAYFAGGWVRDYLMGHPSEDIDIATDAPPEKILDLFPRTILVGLSFGVIVVLMDGHQFEVATFRKDVNYVGGRRPTHIELSTPEEDASRRDFTINGMFYDPINAVVHDFVKGKEDLDHRLIRTIGDPYERFMEDRLRMIRAVRFGARFGFAIDFDTQEAIKANAYTLFPAVAMERVWNEFTKMSKYPHFDAALIDMHRLELLPIIFPQLKTVHLTEIKRRVASFSNFPEKIDTIFYLMELFPEMTPEELEELCRYLRTSVHDANLGIYLLTLRKAVQQEAFDKVHWTHLYAHPYAQRCLQIISAGFSDEKRQSFMDQHREYMEILDRHIVRVAQKKPLVNAEKLKNCGVMPGKGMGILLKEAERISILEDLNDPDKVLNKLKATALWSV